VPFAVSSPEKPYASGAYINTLTDDGQVGLRRAYPPAKLARLTALKDAVDPDNIFHHTTTSRQAERDWPKIN
jgi:Berberine and berberine like